ALSTWWVLSRDQQGQLGAQGVPANAVALVNSSTPLSPTLPTGARDTVRDLAYAPESERWTPALQGAYRAQEEGRYSSAISQYSALVGSASGEEARDALWGLASAYHVSGQDDLAIRTYLLFAGLDDPRAVRAIARIGQIHAENGRSSEAIQAYGEYARRAGPARHAVLLMQARLLGSVPEAEKIYHSVIADNPQDVDLRQALASLAELKSRRGDHAGARDLYDRLALIRKERPRAVLDNNVAPAELLAAGEVGQMVDRAGVQRRLLDYIKSNCKSASCSDAPSPNGLYLALEALLKLDPKAVVSGTISPMIAANISYKAGFYGKAIGHLDTLRATSPGSPDLPLASLMTGKAFDSLGDSASAYNWYTSTVQTYPTSPQAPEAMRRAGDALEEQSAWDNALSVYTEATVRYPNARDETALARVNGGVLAFRLEQRDAALALLRPVLATEAVSPTIKAQAAFWTGKLEQSMGIASWKEKLEQVSTLFPGSFVDFRARSILAGEPESGPIMPTFKESGITASEPGVRYPDEAKEREELLTWAANLPTTRKSISATATIPITAIATITATQDSALGTRHSELPRAVSLLNLGFATEAHTAFRAIAAQMREGGDTLGIAQLVIYLRYHASPLTALTIAETLEEMDAQGDPLKRPVLLLKTLYPTPYGALVMEEAALRDVDPLVMYALMRQESLFVPTAHSHADARGLTQVIPSTGAGIAQQLGDTRYSVEDLFLPHVSIRYGTYYLGSNMPQFDRKLLPTLAAYNGGPGNADRWLAGSALIDPDLYTERIDFFETEHYLRLVYTNYGFYRQIYRP
ncbi:MAG TPA: transglycosylase SLT domain-containing protein, partial [Chloroflexia bacterium]|nr:transglycosylase SLT domain-containing protein [Chloroflexia bacterium]